MMSNFQVEFGQDRYGNTSLQRVPVFYGDPSRQAATILKNNSENMIVGVPAMAVYITGLRYDQSRVQEPYHVNKLNIRQKSYDPITGQFGSTQDAAYTIERLMPVPYTLTLKLDMWTSNINQKLQLIEQMCVYFNPSMEIQSTDNYIDWTSLSVVNRTDISWTSRSVPTAGEETIDIASKTFEIPIWITGPAKIKQLGVVQKVVGSIFDTSGNLSQDAMLESNLMGRKFLTPLGYNALLHGNTIQLLKKSDIVTADGQTKIGSPDLWQPLIDVYGSISAGSSQCRLQILSTYDEVNGESTYTEVVGLIAAHSTDDTLLEFTIDPDTLPVNTLTPITAIIDPTTVTVDSALLTPPIGARYLILKDIGVDDGSNSVVWGTLVAKANDLIEYTISGWVVVQSAATHSNTEYVTNLKTLIQYKWAYGQWSKAVDGFYQEGSWSLVL